MNSINCAGSLGRFVIKYADQVQRELTDLELMALISADMYAGRNWHNLSANESSIIQILERNGYLTYGHSGFIGQQSIPQSK